MPITDSPLKLSCRKAFYLTAAMALLASTTLVSSAASARTAEEKAAIEAKAEAAQRVLEDTGFRDKWDAPDRIRTEKDADRAIDEGNDALDRIERAFDDAKAACNLRFLVNKCIDDAKRLSFERQREIRRVIVAAEEFKRGIRTKEIEAKHEKAASEPKKAPLDIRPKEVKTDRPEPLDIAPKSVKPQKAPLDIAPKSVKAPSEPVDWTPREVKAPSAPTGIAPKSVKAPSAPTGIQPKTVEPPSAPSGLKPKAVKPASEPPYPPRAEMPETNDADALKRAEMDRAELEKANQAYYDEKQADAEKRMREAAQRAEKRKKEREARQQKFEESLKERVEAQKRYEESQKNKDSGLSKFF